MDKKNIIRIGFKAIELSVLISASLTLTGVIFIILIDVIGRYIFNSPLNSSLEVIQLIMLLLGGFSIVYTASKNRHLTAGLFNSRLPKNVQKVIDRIGSVLGFAFWGIFTYQILTQAIRQIMDSEISVLLHIRIGPFLLVAGLSLFLFVLILLKQVITPLETKENAEL